MREIKISGNWNKYDIRSVSGFLYYLFCNKRLISLINIDGKDWYKNE